MSKLSEWKSDKLFESFSESETTCEFCEKKIDKGGFWKAKSDIYVCEDCKEKLIDLLIDTLEDTQQFDNLKHEDKLKYLKAMCETRLLKKKSIGGM